MIINQNNDILLQHRDDKPNLVNANLWSFPGGGVDNNGESLLQALMREVKEETGLVIRDPVWFSSVYNEKANAWNQIFRMYVRAENCDLVRGEGQDLRFFSYDAARQLPLVSFIERDLHLFMGLGVPKMFEQSQPVIDFPDARL